MDDDLLRGLGEIKSSPGLFLGEESISLLGAFLDGYYYGIGKIGQFSSPTIVGFQEYVANRFAEQRTLRWNRIILAHEKDEAAAFKRFFQMFREYTGKEL
jgi:hypothetical protein